MLFSSLHALGESVAASPSSLWPHHVLHDGQLFVSEREKEREEGKGEGESEREPEAFFVSIVFR